VHQITVTIAHGNPRVESLFSRVNAGIYRRHVDLGMDPAELVFVTDCPCPVEHVLPLPHDCFNFAIRQFNYVHAVETLGLSGEDLLLRDADTFQVNPFSFPTRPDRIGFVPWRHGVLNCGAVYVGRDAWPTYAEMISALSKSGHTYDERFVKHYLWSRRENVDILPPRYNWDVRKKVNGVVDLLHIHRRTKALSEELRTLLSRYEVEELCGREQDFFGKYGESTVQR